MQKWRRVEPTTVHRVGYRILVNKTFIQPNGIEVAFTTLSREGSESAAVIALTKDQKVVIARQFRVGPEEVFDELPGGGVEKDEEPKFAAKRELEEETGYSTDKALRYLGKVNRDAYTNSTSHYFIATDCYKAGEPNNDDTEFIEPAEISIAELLHNAKNFKMSDSAGVLLAYDELKELMGYYEAAN